MAAMPVRKADTLPFPLPVPEDNQRLQSLAAEVHRTYFFKYPPLPISWGQQISRKRRRSIRLGSYNHATAEIRIHPMLNTPRTPAFFVQSVIYHEYLHHVLGPKHNRRFHQHERKFLYHRESQEWIRRNLGTLLGMPARKQPVIAAAPVQVQAALF
jgi:hypothetical protein